MIVSFLLYCRIVVFGLSVAVLAGCSHYAYVGMPSGSPMRNVEISTGNTTTTPIGSSLVGVAYEEASDHLFLRLVSGTQLQELDRSGNLLRNFSAQQVPAGCGGFAPDIPVIGNCGLAMRYNDRHLFLNHPSGLLIAEVDINGNFVGNIRLAQPNGPIGGLAYDQKTDTIYVLFVRDRSIEEIDLGGNKLRRLSMVNPQTGASISVERYGLSISSWRRELYLALQNGNRLGVFDLNGSLIAEHVLSHGVTVPGIGAGRRQ